MSRLRQIAHYLLAAALYYSGTLTLRRCFRRLVTHRSEIAVLGLHRVLTAQQAALTCSEPAMVVMLPTFRDLLRRLTQQFHVLSLSDFQSGNIPCGSRPSCLLTFDDAWLDTFENAYPALREAGLPAAVFVPTGLIGSEKFFWVERLSLLWKNCGEKCEALPIALGQELGQTPVRGFDETVAALKCVPAARRESIVSALEARFANGNQPSTSDRFMSWEQLLAMSPIFEAASHTVSHVLLDVEEKAAAENELRESRKVLQKKIGKPVRSVAYPSGSFNQRVCTWARDAGYHWAFTVRSGTFSVGDDPLTVPRSLLQEGNITNPWGKFSPAMFHFRLTGWR
jgi:peptidoglycan/xylan/chitin deacetylase (PgdA/CDA1 family)